MQTEPLKQFWNSWSFVKKMTIEFIEIVPENNWMTSPHSDYRPIAKQIRHMVWVSGLYNNALKNTKIDLKTKKECYSGELDRTQLVQALKKQDEILKKFLLEFSGGEVILIKWIFLGVRPVYTSFCLTWFNMNHFIMVSGPFTQNWLTFLHPKIGKTTGSSSPWLIQNLKTLMTS